MAFITNQWLKGNKERNKFHTPESVRIIRPKALAESIRQKDDGGYTLDWGVEWEIQNNIAYKIGFCKKDGGSNPFRCDSEYQAVYINKDEIQQLLTGLFYSNSIESNRDFLKLIIPSISDEFKFELIKLLLKDKSK